MVSFVFYEKNAYYACRWCSRMVYSIRLASFSPVRKDADVEIIQPLAGDFVGSRTLCHSFKNQVSPDGQYVVLVIIQYTLIIRKFSSKIISNLNYRITDPANNPHEKFAVSLQDGRFVLAPTTRSIRLYEASSLANAAATASATINKPLDLRTSITYTLQASGSIVGDTLQMSYEISNSTATRYKLFRKKSTPLTQPKDSVGVDIANSGDNELDVKCTFKGSREFKAPIVQGG